MTWRERIVAARERRHFTEWEKTGGTTTTNCAAAEVSAAAGVSMIAAHRMRGWPELWMNDYGNLFCSAVRNDEFDEAERQLERIEDRVLALKREL